MWIWWYRNECLVSQLPISTCWVKQEPLFWIQWRTSKEKSISCSTITSIIHLNWPRKCLHKIPTYVVHLEVIVYPTQKRFRKAKLKKEEVESKSRHGDIFSEWKEKRDVLMISNMHTHKMLEVPNRSGKKKMMPNIIEDYNKGMSGIDGADQMISYYDCLRKTARWYRKIELHILDIFLFKTHYLNSKYNVNKSFKLLLKFRETIMTDLIGDSLQEIPQNKTNNTSDDQWLTAIPQNEKKDDRMYYMQRKTFFLCQRR